MDSVSDSTPPGTACFVCVLAHAVGLPLDRIRREAGVAAPCCASTCCASTSPQGSSRMWEALVRRRGDALVGHGLGADMTILSTGVFGPLFAHACDLRSGLGLLCVALAPALSPDALHTRETPRCWELTYRSRAAGSPRHAVEALFATLVSLAREATGRAALCERVELEAPRPRDAARLEAFYAAPVRFDASSSRLRIHRAALELPMIGHDPELADALAAHGPRSPRERSLEQRVVQACVEALGAGDATAAATARLLGVSTRTLHRRLNEAGLRYQEIFDRVAHERALALLDEPSRSVEQIAEALGYGSRTALDRAFARWHGSSPAAYRRRRAAGLEPGPRRP